MPNKMKCTHLFSNFSTSSYLPWKNFKDKLEMKREKEEKKNTFLNCASSELKVRVAEKLQKVAEKRGQTYR